ncbi:probable DNA double-strand break repair Rad50 ATPase isoform X2 [Leptopilina boulardi]|uniref:probable DNA double-strand break repair Rad50 ATPase isoform X2 n=1 Tax=Leptopilina boulardi TaxID=63433 RepID=UPI0021F65AAB|nr:probable DNA double-strand break repair Rad50 ATPase isoform X2 [Leptopilina boulardi]
MAMNNYKIDYIPQKDSYTRNIRNCLERSTPKYHSFHDRQYLEGEGDPHFFTTETQMRKINATNGRESPNGCNLIIKKIQMLEDENLATRKKYQCLFIEKEIEVEKRMKLEKKVAELEKFLQEEREKAPAEKDHRSLKTVETLTTKVQCANEEVQVWQVCRACRRELQSQENNEPIITMTKTELENLEKDMTILRDSILATEETLNRSKIREQNYREQIARLFVEADSSQTLCKIRSDEIKTLTRELSDKDIAVRNMEKNIMDMGKLIIKLNKQLRNHEEFCQIENGFTTEISEREQKWMEDIERRLCNTKGKQRTKDKASSSQQSSPRGVKITERGIES